MGTLRSLGALARALGPTVAASGEAVGQHVMCPGEPGLEGCWALMGPPSAACICSCLLRSGTWGGGGGPTSSLGCLPPVYWLTGALACFTVCSGLFLLPFLLLRPLRPPARTLKEE